MPLNRSRVGQPSLEERERQRREARGEVPSLSPAAIDTAAINYPDMAQYLNAAPVPGGMTYFYDEVQISASPRIERPVRHPLFGDWSVSSPVPEPAPAPAPSLDGRLRDAIERTRTRTRIREATRRAHATPDPNVAYDRWGRPSRVEKSDPVPETPPHLEAKLLVTPKHIATLSAVIKSVRPTGAGRVSAAQHSVLNQLAYKLAAEFEGENNPAYDRAKWLEACGVQTTQRN